MSTGINIAGAIRMAKEMGPGHTIVTILCDFGNRYQSKLFNPEFMRSKGLPVPEWLERRIDRQGAAAVSDWSTELLFRDDAYLTKAARPSWASPSAAAYCSTARCSMQPAAASRAMSAR